MRNQRSLTAAVGLLACVLISFSDMGCMPMVLYLPSESGLSARYYYESGFWSPSREIVAAPARETLKREILAIVQPGMPREEVLRRLKEAGIKGAYETRVRRHVGEAASQGYYCSHLWNRPDGKVWCINSEYYFDESGKLFRIDISEDRALRPDGNPRGKDEIPPTAIIGPKDPDAHRIGQKNESVGNPTGDPQSRLPTSAD